MENRGSLTAWPGAFYLRGQGPSICVARGLLSAWPVAFYLRGQGPSIRGRIKAVTEVAKSGRFDKI